MRVSVRLPGMLRGLAEGHAQLEVDLVDAADLAAALDELAARYPALERRLRDEQGVLRRYVNFYLDGAECRDLAGSASALSEGTEIQVIPSVAGG